MPHLLIFGLGYTASRLAARLHSDGWTVTGTSRATLPLDAPAVREAIADATHILSSVPPTDAGDPVLAMHATALAAAPATWLGYLSSTGVYGDAGGAWVDESAPTGNARREPRVAADTAWAALRPDVRVVRLPGIYGPGRSVVERLRDGSARLVRKPGQVFNRVHVDDAVGGLFASMAKPRPGAAYNLVDDEPAPADVVMAWAAERLGLPRPPEVEWTDPEVSDAMRRFYLDNKRISNARAKAELGWRPMYPTWREGLESMIAG